MNFVKEGSYRSKKEEENQMAYFSSQNKIKNGNTFNGYFFSCHRFVHKAMDCKKLEEGYRRKYKNSIRCWRCNFVGHTTKFFHTMRCYNCDRFGHKSQSCRSSNIQSLNKSFKLVRKPNKSWKNKGDDKSPKKQL
jgi:cyclopropane fatty-acyl-phospholipid synthase-like methyltransferase